MAQYEVKCGVQKWPSSGCCCDVGIEDNIADPKNPQICPIELAGRVSLEVKLLIRTLGAPHELLNASKGPLKVFQRPKMAKSDHESKKN